VKRTGSGGRHDPFVYSVYINLYLLFINYFSVWILYSLINSVFNDYSSIVYTTSPDLK